MQTWDKLDVACIDPRTADLPLGAVACDPRRVFRAADTRTDAPLAKPCRTSAAGLHCPHRHHGEQALRRSEVLVDRSGITQLTRSQQNAADAKARLDADLKAIAAVHPEGVAAIGREVETLTDLARRAGEAYSGDDSVEGNALLAQARSRILNIDDEIDKIVARVEQQALAGRDASARQAERVVELAIIGGMVALAVALGLTAYIVRSITVPLKRLEGSMAAITRGELDVEIPRASAHEIGAMTKALGMLRDSLIERDHLERERRRADAEIRRARDAAEAALRELKAAQANLIQAEKMASLGQLTAGIAHEIKNPLNFVNNFSAVSAELIYELQEALRGASLNDKLRTEIGDITDTLRGNLEKIVQHGKRADGIVKNMLLHSRHGSGEHRRVDVNALVEESLNLAYHGARAEKPGFNVTLERSFDPAAGEAVLFPQEMTRVLLNLISNGFYAATKRKADASGGYEPTVIAATKNLGDSIEIRIREDGTGISPEVKEKMFDPFYTTKPAGEGTGLGLSLSYDIVVKQHGGSIEVETKPGEFTEFRIILPRTAGSLSGS